MKLSYVFDFNDLIQITRVRICVRLTYTSISGYIFLPLENRCLGSRSQ